MSRFRVAVDIGGTFTDICLQDDRDGRIVSVAKVPSTVDPVDGLLTGIEAVGVDPTDVSLLCHGTTVATNALITRSYPRAAMVTTRGFRDVLEIRRGTKENIWDPYEDVAPPPIPRRDRLEVTERVDHTGTVLTALDVEEARAVARVLRRREVASVAVCFINAYASGENEQAMAEILREELPDAHVSISSEVLPEIFEHERFSTTVANAVLAPLIEGYMGRLDGELRERGFEGDVLLLHSGGGVMTAASAKRLGARLAASGLAAGAIACQRLSVSAGWRNAIGLDMGGTSTDVSVVHDSELEVRDEWAVQFGYPICFPSIDVLTVGAGGGSIAWIDEGGSLRSGPQSAGSTPGPACYGRGGDQPTTTDANLVLGRLGAELAGGLVRLDAGRSEAAIREKIAEPLGLDVISAAQAVIALANAKMADAVRVMSVRRGHDPREFALVPFGGAGPVHAADLIDELGMPVALIMPSPGLTSALGCLLVDIRHDFTAMLDAEAAPAAEANVERELARLERDARGRLAAEGVAESASELRTTIDLRYAGQWRSLRVPYAVGELSEAVEVFHREHARIHNYRRDDAEIRISRVMVTAIGRSHQHAHAAPFAVEEQRAAASSRLVHFDGPEPVQTPVHHRGDIPDEAVLQGPCVIEQLDSTVVVPPGFTVSAIAGGLMEMKRA